MHSLTTMLLGGLGNQMFQYAVGRSLSLRHGVELKVDTSVLLDHRPGVHEVNRSYDLDIFNLEVKRVSALERLRYNAHGLPLPFKAIHRAIRWMLGDAVSRERSFRFDAEFFHRSPCPSYLSGLWQSPLYFQDIEEVLRKDFSFRRPLPSAMRDLFVGLSEENSLCLHVRRGDYVTVASNSETIGFIGKEYYRNALSRLEQQVSMGRIFVFSDDLDWCRREMAWLGNNATVVDYPSQERKYETDLQLMTLASHFIIPNSTFSWWAAWLSGNTGKTVIAPKAWFRNATLDAADLCPASWIRI